MAVQTLTAGKDIDYIEKDFNSAVDAMISFANVNFGPGTSANRLWTNFNADSFSRNWLEIVAFIADVFFFYFDVQATQAYLQTATIRSAVRDIAKQFGFNPATASSASGDATFTLTGAGTILRGFRVTASNGEEFFLTNDIVAGTSGDFTGSVLQGIIKTETFSSEGLQNEEFDLVGPNVIRDTNNINPLDRTPQVTVNGNTYSLVNSFIRHDGTDSPAVTDSLGNIIGGGGRVFTLEERPTEVPFVRFGDGIFGRKLAPSETVIVTYRTGGGTAGNIAQQTLTSLTDSSPIVSSVTNNADFSGGADEQSIEQLRDLIPASLRTLERAVSETDFSDILEANFTEVFAASTETNNEDPGIDVNIYVVPQGSGITSITANSLLVNALSNFIDRRKMVTVQFQILDAFGIDSLITLEVFITDTASRSTVSQSITTALVDFFSLTTGGPAGSGVGFAEPILLKDINALIAAIDGVDRFEIKRLTYRPRIAENVFGLLTDFNFSEVTIFPNITESEWLLGSASPVTEAAGGVIFANDDVTGFSYDVVTGQITYDFPVNLEGIGPGDSFRNGPGREEVTEIQTVGDGTGAAEVTKVTTVADKQGVSEVTEITTVSDVGGNLGGTFFTLFDEVGSVAVWFDVDNGNSEPSHGANRSLEVDISANADSATIASAMTAVIDGDSKFTATVTGTAEVTDITCSAFAQINDGEFFLINSANDENEYYAYYDTTGGDLVDPSPVGKLRIRIDISGDATATQVATSTAAALDALGDFIAPNSGTDTLTVTNAANGQTTDALDFNVSGPFAINVTTQGSNADTVTVTVIAKADLFDATDGNPSTGFTFTVFTQGEDIETLDGTFFLIFDDTDSVAFWFDVDDDGTTIPAGAAAAARAVEITTVTANMASNDVATQVQLAVNGDAKFSAIVSTNEVTITDAFVGTRTNASDGSSPTGFTLEVETEGAAAVTIDGTYFLMFDTSGSVAFWFDVDNNGTPIPPNAALANRNIEVTTVTAGMTQDQVATELRAAINGDSEFSAPAPVANLITVTSDDKATLLDALDGVGTPTGFTFEVTTQGVGDDVDFTLLAVDIENSVLFILEDQPVNPVAGLNAGGSVRNGSTTFQSFKCFKKTLAASTNLSGDSITDSNLDLSVQTGTGTALTARILLDNTQVFVPGEFATGDFYLVDSTSNIWEIEANDSNTLTTSITAVNDAAITAVSSGDYQIVDKLVGSQILFNGNIFNIQFNNANTLFSVGAQFTQIGTIGDDFQISTEQTAIGNLGVDVDLISFTAATKEIRLNGSPNLEGINSGNTLIDSSGQLFNIIGIDNRSLPSTIYSDVNRNNQLVLAGTGLGSQYGQGFKVPVTDTYSIVSFNLTREGNILGNLSARIVNDDGTGLPDLSSVVATSLSVDVTDVQAVETIEGGDRLLNSGATAFQKVTFSFTSPPELAAGTQFHLIVSGDSAYAGSQQDGAKTFDNDPGADGADETFTYSTVTGVIQYDGPVDLSGVSPGNYFQDGLGNQFAILSVDDGGDQVTLTDGLVIDLTFSNADTGTIFARDNILVGVDDSAPAFADGELARFDGVVWSNSTLGPSQFSSELDATFTVEGPKTIKIDSDLTPELGPGATISERYYDDNDEISLVIGLSDGAITFASDVNALGRGTVGGVPNSRVDSFVFRTSRFSDDIVNLRFNEIPQIQLSDIITNIFGGVD